MIKAVLIILATLLISGYFFVQWANRPENVAALLKAREEEKKQAVANSNQAEEVKRQQRLATAVGHWKENEIQKKTDADLQLEIDETFQDNHFEYLDDRKTSAARISNNKLIYSATVYKKTASETILALSKKEYENFVGEMEMEIAGDAISLGILFNYSEYRKKTFFSPMDTWKADRVSSRLQSSLLTVNDEEENENLVSLKDALTFKSIPKQTVRIEKKGKHLKVTVNGELKFDKKVDRYSSPKGKIGIYTATSNSTDWNQSVIGTVKSFKVWTWP
ncbi:MAG: hypothetical protein U0X91_01640 [Spirosomataceae bacterium]